jgi:hypothetical protein
MTVRTIRRTISFLRPFYLKGVDRVLPPRDYDVVTDEELIEGLSFPAYHRVSTSIIVPAPSGLAIEMVTIDPLDLEAALEQDAASPSPANESGERSRRSRPKNAAPATTASQWDKRVDEISRPRNVNFVQEADISWRPSDRREVRVRAIRQSRPLSKQLGTYTP